MHIMSKKAAKEIVKSFSEAEKALSYEEPWRYEVRDMGNGMAAVEVWDENGENLGLL